MPRFITNAINAKPALRFDGTNDFLDIVSAPGIDNLSGDIATFAVVRVDDYENYNAIWAKTTVNLPAPNDYYLATGSGIPQVFRGDGVAYQAVSGQRPVRANTYAVIGFKQTGTTLTHYLNGSTNGTGEITVTPGDVGTNLKIGTRDNFETILKGDMAELL